MTAQHRTVGALTQDDVGSTVQVGWLLGELISVETGVGFGQRTLVTIKPPVFAAPAEYRSLSPDTPCKVMPKRPTVTPPAVSAPATAEGGGGRG